MRHGPLSILAATASRRALAPSASVGAPLLIGREELATKIAQSDTAFRAFYDDLMNRLVFITDSNDVTDALAATDANANEKVRLLAEYATDVAARKLQSDANATGKSASTVAAEQAFTRAWLKEYVRFRLFAIRNQSIGAFDHVFTLGDVWDADERFNTELASWQQKAASDFSVRPAAPSPPKEPGGTFAIPWGLVVGAVAAIAIVPQIPTIVERFRRRSTA